MAEDRRNNNAGENRGYERSADRRRKKDWVTRAVPALSIIGWLLAIATMFFLDGAKPLTENVFTRLYGVEIHSVWNQNLLRITLSLLIFVAAICLIGFLFNLLRKRRKSDRFNKSVIILGIIAVLSIIVFLIIFWPILSL